jgi:hypothetical protein
MTVAAASTRAPVRASAQPPATAPAAPADHRSGLASATVGVAIGAGAVKSILLDRARVAVALPHNIALRDAYRAAGQTRRAATVLPKWGAELLTAKLTHDVVPVTGGVVRVGGRVLTRDGFGLSYRCSNGAGQVATLLNLSYALPNLLDGLHHGGVSGLLDTRSGRTGVFGMIGNTATLGLMGVAFARAPGEGGLLARAGAALGSKWLASGKVVLANSAPGLLTLANELGAFDSFDAAPDHG